MPTFLTTSKMSPELADRIRASVSGRRKQPARRRLSPSIVAVARGTGVMVLLFVIVSIVMVRRRNHDEREQARARLLSDLRAKSGGLTPRDLEFSSRVEDAVAKQALPYPGDTVADELRGPTALTTLLTRPMVYVRGPISSMGSAKTVPVAAATSAKDSLVSCLVEPPKARTEKAMLPRVRAAYARDAAFEKSTANIARLADAEAGLPFLAPEWAARVTTAEELPDIAHLRKELEHAPVDRAVQAARSEVLLVAMDEEGDRTGPTELDGERPHKLRVAIVDLRSQRVLLRIQRAVDPRGFSDAERAIHASGLDSCGVAMDMRDLVQP